ncbi:hypothetical protein BOQ62_03545 [Chryseobacterium sp. CH21]|nr:hypothetical protein BOQ62_03545 [Chryseobacterium sp. CH21]
MYTLYNLFYILIIPEVIFSLKYLNLLILSFEILHYDLMLFFQALTVMTVMILIQNQKDLVNQKVHQICQKNSRTFLISEVIIYDIPIYALSSFLHTILSYYIKNPDLK